MTSKNFYVVRHEPSDAWQLCSKTGMPCMARGTREALLRTADKLAAVKANGLSWPMDVMHVINDDIPGTWSGTIGSDGVWTWLPNERAMS